MLKCMQKIIIASGPVIVEDGKVLLNKHGDTEFWKFCGGKVEDSSESLIDAAKRELREEMGVECNITNQDPFIMYTKKTTADGDIDVILVHFLGERVGEVRPGTDIREWRWVEFSELNKEDLAPNILPALKYFGFIK